MTDKAREEFEAAVISNFKEVGICEADLSRDAKGRYVYDCHNAAWWAWQASRVAPKPSTVRMDVFYMLGDDPFICAINGRICLEQIEEAQKDFNENIPDELEQGDGIYTFDFFYEKGQYDEYGRCEIAPGWGFDFVSYDPFDHEEIAP